MGRRGNNEGTIVRRRDGRWEAKVTVGYDARGKIKRRSVYGATRADVQRKMTKLHHDIYSGTLSDARGHTLGSYRREWLDRKSLDLAPTTERAYHYALEKFAPLDRLPLEGVNAFQIERIYSDMRKEKLKPRTIQISHTTLSSAMKDAVRWRLLPRNFMEDVRPPKQVRSEIAVWTQEEVRSFLNATRENRLWAAWYLVLCTGLRRAEVLGLHWSDLHLEDSGGTGRVNVRRNVVSTRGVLTVKEPKTAASKRIVHIAPDVVEVMRSHRARQAAEAAASGLTPSGNGPVFTSLSGGYLDPHNLSRAFRALVKRAGVTPVGLHALRHTHASILIKQQFDPKVVSERLGHTNVAFTQSVYQHLYDEQRSEAAIGLSDLLS